jgi:hypothetical protein
MVIFLDSKGAWPLSHCRPDFLCEPGNVLGARAGIIALRAGLRGALFVLAKVRQLIFFQATWRGAPGGASIYWDFGCHQEAVEGNSGGATWCCDVTVRMAQLH